MTDSLNPDEMPAIIATLWPLQIGRDRVRAGINEDDCAVLQWREELVVVTADYLNARPIATELGLGSIADLGRLLVLLNLADLCGTGAEPQALLVALTMLRSDTEDAFLSLMGGIESEAAKWNVPIVGGDTKLGDARALLGVALGSAHSLQHLFLKNRAKPGEFLWCSGPLGSCNAAAIGLRRANLTPEFGKWATAAILSPKLPLDKSRAASRLALGTAGTDVSDGLGSDLWRLCEASKVGSLIHAASIPIEPEVRDVAGLMGLPPWAFSFGGGGDCQFLLTSPPSSANELAEIGFQHIGTISGERGCRIQLESGVIAPLPRRGHTDSTNIGFVQEITQLMSEMPTSGETE
jgi:thiamine-monophosphate kinase